MLAEGSRTQGVWLPLALADLMRMMIVLARRSAGDTGEIRDLPETSDVLRRWALPMMAEACHGDEEERKALELLRSVERLSAKQQGKT